MNYATDFEEDGPLERIIQALFPNIYESEEEGPRESDGYDGTDTSHMDPRLPD